MNRTFHFRGLWSCVVLVILAGSVFAFVGSSSQGGKDQPKAPQKKKSAAGSLTDEAIKKKLDQLDQAIEKAKEARKQVEADYKKTLEKTRQALKDAKDSKEFRKAADAHRKVFYERNQAIRKAIDEYQKAIRTRHDFFRQVHTQKGKALPKKPMKPLPPLKVDKNVEKAKQALNDARKNWREAIQELSDFRRKNFPFKEKQTKDALEKLEKAADAAREGISEAHKNLHQAIQARHEKIRQSISPSKSKGKTEPKKGKSQGSSEGDF